MQNFLQLIPFSQDHLQQIFDEVKDKHEGTYKLSAKLPWHFLIRPDLRIKIVYFKDRQIVRLICAGCKTVEFTFDKITGTLLNSSRQAISMWPVSNELELDSNIQYAHSLLVRYGVNPRMVSK